MANNVIVNRLHGFRIESLSILSQTFICDELCAFCKSYFKQATDEKLQSRQESFKIRCKFEIAWVPIRALINEVS